MTSHSLSLSLSLSRSLSRSLALALALAPALAIPSLVYAQIDPDLTRGRSAREAGDHTAALSAFSAAWEHTSAPIARAEMALEELALGDFVLAEAHATDALAFATDPEVAALLPALTHARDDAAAHLGSLDVRCLEGCVITIDGHPAGTTPLAHLVRVTSGTHVVHADLEDYEPAQASVDVAVLAIERVTLEPVYIDDRPILSRTGGVGDGERIAGGIAIGVGGVSLVIGAVALGVELDRDSLLRSEACAPIAMGTTREQRCPDAASTRTTYTDVARNMLLLGAGLAVVGLVFILTAPSDPAQPRAACVPSLGPGFACQVTF